MLDVTTRDGCSYGSELIPIIAVHVHAITFLVTVGIVEHTPCFIGSCAVRNGRMVTNERLELVLERTVLQAISAVIETVGKVLRNSGHGAEHHER